MYMRTRTLQTRTRLGTESNEKPIASWIGKLSQGFNGIAVYIGDGGRNPKIKAISESEILIC